jgi:hypothetical protein
MEKYNNGRPVTIKVGDRFTNNDGAEAEVIEYKNAKAVVVRFIESGHIVSVQAHHLLHKKTFKDHYFPKKDGGCHIGKGSPSLHEDGTTHKIYILWAAIIRRCYKWSKEKDACYEGCTIADEWKCYSDFYNDCIKDERHTYNDWQLDKDLLVKGNKVYSKDTCCFLPREINSFLQGGKSKNKGLPVGVYLRENGKCYRVILGVKGKLLHLGQYTSVKEAAQVYKEAKEKHLKSLAEQYKHQLDPRAYQALINYTVEITD